MNTIEKIYGKTPGFKFIKNDQKSFMKDDLILSKVRDELYQHLQALGINDNDVSNTELYSDKRAIADIFLYTINNEQLDFWCFFAINHTKNDNGIIRKSIEKYQFKVTFYDHFNFTPVEIKKIEQRKITIRSPWRMSLINGLILGLGLLGTIWCIFGISITIGLTLENFISIDHVNLFTAVTMCTAFALIMLSRNSTVLAAYLTGYHKTLKAIDQALDQQADQQKQMLQNYDFTKPPTYAEAQNLKENQKAVAVVTPTALGQGANQDPLPPSYAEVTRNQQEKYIPTAQLVTHS